MRHTVISLAAISLAAILSGYQTPPAPAPKEPFIVRYESNVDPVHVRDVSAHRHLENRGGAALRAVDPQEDVLWQNHYVGETNPERLKASASGTDEVKVDTISPSAEKQTAPSKTDQRDMSVYSKRGSDASIYANHIKEAR